MSLVYPPSHCEACGSKLALGELFPVLSYILLRGKCNHCSARIPARVPIVELSMGLLFVFLFFSYGLEVRLLAYIFYLSLFTLIFVIDLDRQIIPNILLYPSIPIAFVLSVFLLNVGWASSLTGGGLAFLFLLIPYLVSKGGMGGGDVKLAGLIGLALGFPDVLAALFLAIISGGIFATILLLLRIKGRKSAIPFGPFLSLSAFVSLIWGQELIRYYLSIIS